MKKIGFLVLAIGTVVSGPMMAAGAQVRADKPVRNTAFMTSEVDLYCSFFVLEARPTLKILGGDGSRSLFSDGDQVYFRGNGSDLPAEGQLMSVLELGLEIPGPDRKSPLVPLAIQRGRVRVLKIVDGTGTGRVENACGSLMTGQFLVPFLAKEKFAVKDAGLEGARWAGGSLSGRVIFLEDGAVQIATGQRALINLGREHGLELGRQLTVFVQSGPDQPYEASANVVVIDVGKATATVKALTAKAPIRAGDPVQVK